MLNKIAEDAVHRIFYHLLKKGHKDPKKMTESMLTKCFLRGKSKKKFLKQGGFPGAKIKMKNSKDPLYTAKLFQKPLVVHVIEGKGIQTTSIEITYKKRYRHAFPCEIPYGKFTWPIESSDLKKLEKDIQANCDDHKKLRGMKDSIQDKIIEKYKSNNEKLVKLMVKATRADEFHELMEEVKSSAFESFNNIARALNGIGLSRIDNCQEILSELQKIRKILSSQNNALEDDKRKNDKFDTGESFDPRSHWVKTQKEIYLPFETVIMREYETRFEKGKKTEAWARNQASLNAKSLENFLEPIVAYSGSSGDVSINMEEMYEVPNREQNHFDTFESSLNSTSSLDDQSESMVSKNCSSWTSNHRCMYWKEAVFVIVRLTKIMNRADKNWAHF